MLEAIGLNRMGDLFRDIKPEHAPRSFQIPDARSEYDVVQYVRALAQKNASDLTLFVGGGYYDHYIPAVIPALAGRGEFLTAYTPYQPECAQGTLQALYEYQSSICALTAMDAANASLYDGGTALYEAMMMAMRVNGRTRVLIDEGVNPIFRTIIHSYTHHLNMDVVTVPLSAGRSDREKFRDLIDQKTSAVIIQNPNFLGTVEAAVDIVEMAHQSGALVIQSVYPIALGLITAPGEIGVDIVTGEGQSLGLPLSFGGPYLGFMAVKKELMRKMPGRIVGATIDTQGRRCFVNTLQAREQHIRREKATSNICTNVALCALQASMAMALMGRQGIRELAQLNRDKAEYLKKKLTAIAGVKISDRLTTFNEFTVDLPVKAEDVINGMIDDGFAAGFPLGRYYTSMERAMIVAVTEKRTRQDMDDYAQSLQRVLTKIKSAA